MCAEGLDMFSMVGRSMMTSLPPYEMHIDWGKNIDTESSSHQRDAREHFAHFVGSWILFLWGLVRESDIALLILA
jgi:hypothetical protein